ncbi:MAG: hypothetical protein IT545_09870 [Rhodobacteraceae bacterium]|nr:hypothetical protein [Paracoccaceae bacterium]
MSHVLAPVPALHLPAAAATFARAGRVAFGSNAWEFWRRQAPGQAVVWIVASATDFPAGGVPGIDPGKVVFRGGLLALVAAVRGRHPDPGLRPATTASDLAWAMFFELDGLERLARPLPVIGILTLQGARLARVPQGPIAIRDPGEAPP